jgi:ribosomal protein S18 acetylase RimI-like enzyme
MAPTTLTDEVLIREMTPGDGPRLEQMYCGYEPLGGTLGLPPVDAGERGEWLESLGRGVNLVAEVGDRIAGHLALLATGGAAEIVLYVHQDFRRRGVATALLGEAIECARAAGFSYVWLLIARNNLVAQRLLRRLRFRLAWEDMHEMQFMLPTG